MWSWLADSIKAPSLKRFAAWAFPTDTLILYKSMPTDQRLCKTLCDWLAPVHRAHGKEGFLLYTMCY